MVSPSPSVRKAPRPEWQKELVKFQQPDHKKAVWQLVNTLVPYVALWAIMAAMINNGVSYWLVLPLIVLAGGLTVRIFIFHHDCGHDCFFATKRLNRLVGYITGVLTFTPFDEWRHQHAMHHAGSGNLDRRGIGDIWMMTVEEYNAAPPLTKLFYRFYRHPFTLLVLGPPYLFLIGHRFWHRNSEAKGKRSVLLTNLGIAVLAGTLMYLLGWKTYLMIQLPVIGVAAVVGVWLFYVQHQYERPYWAHQPDWDPVQAAMQGSSYYKLPKVLQWFSGNIGLHHIHHLKSRIPNYHLQAAYDSVPETQCVEPLTLLPSFKCLFLNLWDEQTQNMVSFRAARKRRTSTGHADRARAS